MVDLGDACSCNYDFYFNGPVHEDLFQIAELCICVFNVNKDMKVMAARINGFGIQFCSLCQY